MESPNIFDPDFQQQSVESKLAISLERIAEAFRVLLWQESKANRLTPLQVQLLIHCAHHSVQQNKVSSLTRAFNMTKGTVSEAVKTLVEKGYLQRESDPADGRAVAFWPTAAGAALAQQVARFAGPLHGALSELTAHQQGVLLESLLELIAKLQRAGIISLNRMCFSCRYYEKKADGHYCHLLQAQLSDAELRIDCPEHATAE
jgi:DNA-binding MarR family transcriptional regulator